MECGEEDYKCRGISYSVRRWNSYSHPTIISTIDEYVESGIKTEKRNIVLHRSSSPRPLDSSDPTIQTLSTPAPLFQIGDG
jgi:hypothetical protein